MLGAAYEDDGQLSKAMEQYLWYQQLCDSAERSVVQAAIVRVMSGIAKNSPGAKETTPAIAAPKAAGPAVNAPRPAPVVSTVNTPAAARAAAALLPAGTQMPAAMIVSDSLYGLATIDTLCDAGQQLLIGIHEYGNNNFDRALGEFRHGAAVFTTGALAAACRYNAGLCYLRLALLQEAENQFQQVLDRFPRDPLAPRSLFLKAMIYAGRKDPAVADRLFRNFITACPRHPWRGRAWERLGDACVDMGQASRAIDAYGCALDAAVNAADRTSAFFKRGEAYQVVGNVVRAAACYDSAIVASEGYGGMPSAWYRAGDLQFRQREYAAALGYYSKAVYKFPGGQETPWGLFQVGNCRRNLRQYREAADCYTAVMKRFPGSYWAGQAKWKADDAAWEKEYFAAAH